MFNVFRRSIVNQKNRFKKGFEEIFRPIVDDALESVFQRRGAIRGNFPNSSSQNTLESLNNFLGRHQFIINAGISTLSVLVSFVGLNITYKTYEAQLEANNLTKELIKSNEEVVKSNEKVVEALKQRSQEESTRRYIDYVARAIDLVQIGRNLFDFARFGWRNRNGRPSGNRNPGDSNFDTPPSGSAFRENRSRRGGSL